MTVKEIKARANIYINDFAVIAIRTQEVPFAPGIIKHVSKVWADGEELETELDGVSATLINSKSLIMHSSEHTGMSGFYYGNYQAIIGGNDYELGEDEGEVIIKDALVLDFWEKEVTQ